MFLEGNLHACLEYAELTGGKGFEDAYQELSPQLMTFEQRGVKGLDEAHAFKNPEPWVALLWGFSATWRAEDGWNDEHSYASDLGVSVRKSKRFMEFTKGLTFKDYRDARPVLLEMLLLTMFVPEDLEPKSKKKVAPKGSKKKPTGRSIT